MITERTTIGSDVHAAGIVAAAIDEQTGELRQRRFGPCTIPGISPSL